MERVTSTYLKAKDHAALKKVAYLSQKSVSALLRSSMKMLLIEIAKLDTEAGQAAREAIKNGEFLSY